MRLPTLASPFPGFWPGLNCALAVWGATLMGWTAGLEGVALDNLFRARGARDADPRVVIVAVDDATVVRAGEKTGAGWPLPRSYYARAMHDLKRLGAKVVAFDVLFAEPGPDARHDLALARETGAAGNIVAACAFQVPAQSLEISSHIGAALLPARFALPRRAEQNLGDFGARRAVWATAPLPTLASNSPALGHVNVFPEASGTLRRAPHLLWWRDQLFPSLSLAGAAQFLGVKPTLNLKSREIELAGRRIPLDSNAQTLVNWIGAGQSYPKWSLNQLLDGQIPEDAIRGRIVILGVTALGAFEHRATPFAGGIPSVDFQANALDDILSNRLLHPVAAPISTLLLLGFPLGCALVTARRGGNRAWPVAVLMVSLGALGLFCLRHNLYLPIGAPLLGGALAFASAAALGYRREWEAVARFDAASSSLARGTTLLGAALGASTKDEAQLLEIIRVTALQTLGAREVWIVLDNQNPGVDSRALFGARQAQNSAQTWIFPAPKTRLSAPRTPNQAASGQAASGQAASDFALLRGQTLLAAPLPRTTNATDRLNPLSSPASSIKLASPNAAAPNAAAPNGATETLPRREFHGALVALGTRDGAPFSARDAAMLETLAEGAALALENFRYANALRGRIRSADLELEGAHQLLAEQSAKLFVAIESIDAALIITNSRGDAAFVNAAAPAILLQGTPELGENVAQVLSRGELSPWALWFDQSARYATPNASPIAPPHDPVSSDESEVTNREVANRETANREAVETETAAFEIEEFNGFEAAKPANFEGEETQTCEYESGRGGFGDAATLRGEMARGRQHLSAQFTPLWSSERRFLGAMLVVSDVTAQRDLATMKSDFVGFVAHELRTPLTTILGYTSLLETMGAHFSPDETRDITQTISRHCRRMNAMISDLLDISRLESGQPLPIRREAFDLCALCERLILEQKSYLNPTPRFEIDFCCEARALLFNGDCDRIEQVMGNLLSNAVKYSPAGGHITVSLRQSAHEVEISVADQGLGLSENQIARMFQKFYRTEDSKSRGIKGNGLGLNLVKQIVEAHGGEIWVESERDDGGRGSVFRVKLPVE